MTVAATASKDDDEDGRNSAENRKSHHLSHTVVVVVVGGWYAQRQSKTRIMITLCTAHTDTSSWCIVNIKWSFSLTEYKGLYLSRRIHCVDEFLAFAPSISFFRPPRIQFLIFSSSHSFYFARISSSQPYFLFFHHFAMLEKYEWIYFFAMFPHGRDDDGKDDDEKLKASS